MHVLYIEDDEGLIYLLRQALEAAQLVVTAAVNGQAGLEQLSSNHFDVVLVDNEMPGISGLQVIEQARSLPDVPPLIMITGAGSEEIAVQAMRVGASDYIVKDAGLGYLKVLPTVLDHAVSERRLAEAHRAAERALALEKERARVLGAFIRDASHEFRTPLSVVSIACHMLRRVTAGSPDVEEYIHRIETQSDVLLRLVDKLVQLADLDTRSGFDGAPVHLSGFLENMILRARHRAQESGVTVSLESAESTIVLIGSADALEIAFDELLGNALHYSRPNGRVVVTLARNDTAAIVTIADDGVGIDPGDLPHVFERFYRADKAHSTSGFGLGLPIAARVIDLHGGDIEIDSRVGVGTTVTVRLPLAQGA